MATSDKSIKLETNTVNIFDKNPDNFFSMSNTISL